MNNRQKFEEWFKREVFSLELANKNLVNCYWDAWEAATDQLQAQVKQLAAENALFKQDYMKIPALRARGWTKTPDTDAILASLRAEGVEMFASETEKLEWNESTTRFVRKFAAQLCSKSEVQS